MSLCEFSDYCLCSTCEFKFDENCCYCYDCENEDKQIHDIWTCTKYERRSDLREEVK